MSKRAVKKSAATTLTRRRLLTAAGAGVAGAAATRLIAPWEAGAAPAQIRGSSLRILVWSHFVPAYDVAFDKYANDWGVENAVTVRVDHIPIDQLPARIASELAAGAGHDVVQHHTQILVYQYHQQLVDVSDICERIGKAGGGFIPMANQVARVNGTWYLVPEFYIAQPMLWRADLFQQYGLKDPGTWDAARVAARVGKGKTPKHDTGIQISHCNDSNHDWRAIFYAFGVKETDPSGKEIAWDSKELRQAMRFGKAMYDEGMTPQVLSWDNVSDNRYLGSGVAIWIHDAISAFRSIQNVNPDLYSKINVAGPWIEPLGPVGHPTPVMDPIAMGIWKFSKNQAAARAFLEKYCADVKFSMTASKGYNMPMLQGWYKKPMPVLGTDPTVTHLQDMGKWALVNGYPGPYTAAAAEVLATFVIPDMMTRYVQSNDLEGSIKWGIGQIKSIYAKYKS
jgi:multiple sugar transport system substrate-binding protein